MTKIDCSKITVEELINLYGSIINELKNRNIIRTNNIIGDLGEFLAINHYCNTPKLTNLQAAPVGTENIDAIDRKGRRYSIKSTSSNSTGVFHGLNPNGSTDEEEQKFEYVIICRFNSSYKLISIYQLDWKSFLKHKKWHKRMQAWSLSITKELIKDSETIFTKST